MSSGLSEQMSRGRRKWPVRLLIEDDLFVGEINQAVCESKWPEFISNQIEHLVKDGYDRAAVERLHEEKGKDY
jgi:hypothetical protein